MLFSNKKEGKFRDFISIYLFKEETCKINQKMKLDPYRVKEQGRMDRERIERSLSILFDIIFTFEPYSCCTFKMLK